MKMTTNFKQILSQRCLSSKPTTSKNWKSLKQSKVPTSRTSRLMNFGGLALNIGATIIGKYARNKVSGKSKSGLLMSKPNAMAIVETLSHVRGAAMKLGQMLSLQDNHLLPSDVQDVFSQLRNTANFMPSKQLMATLNKELGCEWQTNFQTFEMNPFAAASIGQVHRAILKGGLEVAVKVQYPGVHESIKSDIDNLASVLRLTGLVPRGLYAEKMLSVARKELAWEVDYEREKACLMTYKGLVEADDEMRDFFSVPSPVHHLCTKRVLTTDFVNGKLLDDVGDLTQDERDKICSKMFTLCMKEIFHYNYMQTDPNWSNFIYSIEKNKIFLIDFGASRSFTRSAFTDYYIQVIKAAQTGSKDVILDRSLKLGFLTGYETKEMTDAHVQAVSVLGKPFRGGKPFDFSAQQTTGELSGLISTMLKHRLTPPPEETYSLHRKLSGAFLLCFKLKGRVQCGDIFNRIYTSYNFSSESGEKHMF